MKSGESNREPRGKMVGPLSHNFNFVKVNNERKIEGNREMKTDISVYWPNNTEAQCKKL